MRKKRNSNDDELLTLPDFQSEALESVTGLRLNDENGVDHLHAVNVKIDERITKLSGLFDPHGRTPVCSNNVEQLVDLVIGRDQPSDDKIEEDSSQVPRDEFDINCDLNSSYSHEQSLRSREIKSLYQQRRREQCHMAKSYIEQNTRNNRLPWLADPLDEPNHDERVHVDSHGRLVLSGSDVPLESHRRNDLELLDAADAFWKHQSGIKPKVNDAGNSHNQNLNFPAPLQDMHLTQRVSEQMERDARGAIERSLQRYRRHDNIAIGERVFELIPISITHREDVNQRWFQFRQNFNAQPENNIAGIGNNNNDARLPNNLRRQPAGLDVRLAFRRICFAVVTVVAAFVCTIFQDIPYLQYFEDLDGIHINSSWFTGLLGPHPDELSIIEDSDGKHMNSNWFTGLLGPHPDELSVVPSNNGRDAKPQEDEMLRYEHILNGPLNDESDVSHGSFNQAVDNECTDGFSA